MNSKEELDMLATANPQINTAKGVLLKMSEDERTRLIYESIEKKERDERARTKAAMKEGITIGTIAVARNMLKANMSTNEIVLLTGLSIADIEGLRYELLS
ncbi:MAG: hypothetical protein LBN42_04835 [Oscillospiraceae bacterium]|jgi:predicted transposase YdaD|nr:hypothetical protein [Oscillospiraceae bacterium]